MSNTQNQNQPPEFTEARKAVTYYFSYPTHWFTVSSLVDGVDWHWQLFEGGPKGKCIASRGLRNPYATKEAALEAAWEAYQKEIMKDV